MKNKNVVILKNWAIVEVPCPENTPPELKEELLTGNAYGHLNFEDGMFITTSVVTGVDRKNKTISTYSGSVYSIAKNDVLDEYEEIYPNAYERVFNRLDLSGF